MTEVNLIWNRCDKSRRSTLWWPPPACGQLLSFITVKGGENSFSRWNWNWIMLPQMLTGDLDSSLANLASNLDFGNGAKKWGNCFLIHFGGKIASERNQPKSTEWICKNTFFLGTYYRVGRVVPQWPRCIENFLLSVTIIPVFGLISGVCIVMYVYFSYTPGFLDLCLIVADSGFCRLPGSTSTACYGETSLNDQSVGNLPSHLLHF